MNSSGVSAALHRGFEVHPPDSQAFQPRHMKCDLLGSSSNGMNGAPFSTERVRVRIPRSSVGKLSVVARIRKGKKTAETEYPWSDKVGGNIKEGYLSHLSRFKPLPTKPKPFTLPFERPLAELEKKIAEVRDLANDTGMDFSEQIIELEQKYEQLHWQILYGCEIRGRSVFMERGRTFEQIQRELIFHARRIKECVLCFLPSWKLNETFEG